MGVDILPASLDLAAAERELWGLAGGQTRLQRAFSVGPLAYDYVVIDAPPSLGALTLNALAAAQRVIVPVSASFFALQGLSMLQSTIDDVKQFLNAPGLEIAGILVTFADNTNVAADVERILRQQFGGLVYDATIPRNVRIEESHSRQMSVFDYAPEAAGAVAYEQFTDEVLNRE
jgi:chromosome partitioning protein